MTDPQPRQDRNAARRAKRRAEGRARMIRHAAGELTTYGPWENGRPTATPADIARKANAMYGGYVKGEPITAGEAADTLAALTASA
ncbi:hypothetical protein ACFVUH_18270 [Kitasatospora sp. NPDC058032]|uniref:hypothetical protein n=1 Tax=Kitasatospora sp. NPDC058032 TaxID=3346307 RepID=UPI0036DC6C30